VEEAAYGVVLGRLVKNSKLRERAWKSGPSGPRESLEINVGLSPGGRRDEEEMLLQQLAGKRKTRSEIFRPARAFAKSFVANVGETETRIIFGAFPLTD